MSFLEKIKRIVFHQTNDKRGVDVVTHCYEKEVWIYDVEVNNYECKVCDYIVREWEIEKVDEYFSNVIQLINKPIDCFYFIVIPNYYNEIRKKFVGSAKKHGIRNFQFIDFHQHHATLALKYIHEDSDSLWIFNSLRSFVMCTVWEKKGNTFSMSEDFAQEIYLNDVANNLQNFFKKIHSKTKYPIVLMSQKTNIIIQNAFHEVFNDYLNIPLYFTDYSLYNFLRIIVMQKKKEILYKVLPILGREIRIEYDVMAIERLDHHWKVPIQYEKMFLPLNDEIQLNIYEHKDLTQTLNFQRCSARTLKEIPSLNIEIDSNAIFKIKVKTKDKVPRSILEDPGERSFKIPLKLPEYDRNFNAVGIDFGTTECCAYFIGRHGPQGVVLDPATAKRNMSSYIDLMDPNNPCGQVAMHRMVTNAKYSVFDVKRLIGKKLDEINIDPLWPFEVINYCEQIYLIFDKEKENPWIRSPSAISSLMLEHIKQKVDELQGEILGESYFGGFAAVITIPSTFTNKQKNVIRNAADNAGYKLAPLLPEPIAAIIAYSYEMDIPNNSTVFLYDCGGGTTDICIAKILDGNIEVLFDNGDSLLGGHNFDNILINYFGNKLKQEYGLNVLETNKKYKLMMKCRELKHTLSILTGDILFVDEFQADENGKISITRDEFEIMSTDLIFRAKNLIAETLQKAHLHHDQIDIVLQAGGGCRMPIIKEMLKEIFPKAQHQCSIHPEELVAKGAALFAYELKGSTNRVIKIAKDPDKRERLVLKIEEELERRKETQKNLLRLCYVCYASFATGFNIYTTGHTIWNYNFLFFEYVLNYICNI